MHRRETEDPDPLHHLTVRERRFVEAYLGDAGGIGTKAAELAGYTGSRHSLKCYAHQLLKRPEVRAAITALIELDPLVPGRIERLRFLGEVMRGERRGERMNAEGDVVLVGPSISEQQRACEELAKLAGDHQRVAPGDKPSAFPPGLTVDELFELAGVPRPPPRAPLLKPEAN